MNIDKARAKGTFEGCEATSGKTIMDTIPKRKGTLTQCQTVCKREVEVKEGHYAPIDPDYGGPEYVRASCAPWHNASIS